MKLLVIILASLASSDLIGQNRLGNNRLALVSYRPVERDDCFECQIFQFLSGKTDTQAVKNIIVIFEKFIAQQKLSKLVNKLQNPH